MSPGIRAGVFRLESLERGEEKVNDVPACYRLALGLRRVDLLALSLDMLALNLRKVVSQSCDAWYLALSEGEGVVVGTKNGAEVEIGRGVD